MSRASLQALLGSVPEPIRRALIKEFVDLEARFARSDWGPAELNGGRLAEALLRYLEWKQSGTFTPLGTQLNRTVIINRVEQDSSLPEGVRFHVRRCTDLLMDFRNKRDVAHLGTGTDTNEMDAHLVMRLAAWCLSEVVREEGGAHPRDVQRLVDRLSSTHVPLVEEIDGDLLVVASELKAHQKALVALYHAYPEPLDLETLRTAVGYKNKTRFPSVLKNDGEQNLIHRKGSRVFLTRKGIAWVEKHVTFELRV